MEKWKSWYAKYLDHEFLYSSGHVWGHPSKAYSTSFLNKNVDYIGHGKRNVVYKSTEFVNDSFENFLRQSGQENVMEHQYRMISSSFAGGFRAVSKYDVDQPVLDEGLWLLAGEWTKTHFMSYMRGSEILPTDVVLTEMSKTTSAGYPWSIVCKDKNDFLANPRLYSVVDDYWDLIGNGFENEIMPIWTCSQKVELRSKQKIAEGKIRVFTACPVELSIATNRLCLHMNEKFYESANKTWSCVGFTKYYGGWDRLYSRLNVHPHAYELDETNYDASVFEAALHGQMLIRWDMLRSEDKTSENWNRLYNVYYNIVHSVIVLDNGEFIWKHTGNPSGSSNTVVDNTMILFRLFAYAWLVICKNIKRQTTYVDFTDNVEGALYGDDNTYTCSDEANQFFTPIKIGEIWSNISVTTKTPCNESRPLKDVEFLSHGFIWDDEIKMWFPNPSSEKILCSLMYGSSTDDVRWHLLRAYALRLESWANPTCRRIITDYIDYVCRKHSSELVGSVNGISMREIENMHKSDFFLYLMYTGHESSENNKIHGTALNFSSNKLIYQSAMVRKNKKIKKEIKQIKKIAKKISKAPKLIGSIKGNGMYKIKGSVNGGPPQFGKRDRNTIVRHREYIGDVVSSVGFNINYNIGINPGDRVLGPWLSSVAQNFEEYRLHSCVFMYKATSAAALSSSHTSLGTVILATQYDPYDDPFTSKREMENYEFAQSCMPFKNAFSGVDCRPKQTAISVNKYVRGSGGVGGNTPLYPPGSDKRMYDWGTFVLATSGMQQSGDVIGELWVTFEVELIKPKIWGGLKDNAAFMHLVTNYTTNLTTKSPFGDPNMSTDSMAVMSSSNGFPVSFPKGGGQFYQIKFGEAGNYLIRSTVSLTTPDVSNPIVSLSGGVTTPNFEFLPAPGSSHRFIGSVSDSNGDLRYWYFEYIISTPAGGSIGVDYNTLSSKPVDLTEMIICRLPAGTLTQSLTLEQKVDKLMALNGKTLQIECDSEDEKTFIESKSVVKSFSKFAI